MIARRLARGRAVAVCLWLVGLGLSGGCQLPDAGPFVDGTAQLKGAVAAGGAAVEQELRHSLGDEARADTLHQNWEARNKAMAALLWYAQAIDGIVAAELINETVAEVEKLRTAVAKLI